eukprot:m.126637 g.126637  ORF g.126637 m.126637 type:complete len:310 (+) comp9710_c1_seq3:62-991(+)
MSSQRDAGSSESWRASAAGALAGFLTRGVAAPLDVIKIRFQLQIEPVSHASGAKYRSLLHCIATILREESLSGLWKGHVPAQFLSIAYSAVQFPVYERVHHLLGQAGGHPNMTNFGAGAIAGMAATTITYPLDILRTRFASQGNHVRVYTSIFQAARHIHASHATVFDGFFRGWQPAVLSIAPLAGCQFAFYMYFRRILHTDEMAHPLLGKAFAGGASGVLSKLIVYPLDTVKKRLQIQGFELARRPFGQVAQYHGPWHCVTTIARQEGAAALYKGLYPAMIKAAVTTMLSFTFYEWATKLFHFAPSDL